MGKKLYRHKLSFKKSELAGRVSLGASGISMPYLGTEDLKEYKQDFTKQGLDIMQLGMLGNDPKFYEGLGDIAPKPEDFVEIPFRLISATIVGGASWKATDFSDVKMLKKSTNLLDGKPVYVDHETDVNNWAGIVNGVKWTKAFTNDDGTPVPAGIDGVLAIDKKTNPKLARGLLLGAIYSNSVTVEFDWEMSHEFENEWDFLNSIGSFGADGKMVRRIAKTVYNYHESSLVWLGADPFAKAITPEGNLKHIDISSVYSFTKQSFSKNNKIDLSVPDAIPADVDGSRKWTVNFAVDKNVLSLARRKQTIKNNRDMDKFWLAFVTVFGDKLNLSATSTAPETEEGMQELLNKLSFSTPEQAQQVQASLASFTAIESHALEVFKSTEGNAQADSVDIAAFMKGHNFVATDKVAGLETKITALTADKDGLALKVAELTPNAELGKNFLGMKRTEAIRLYKAAVGEDKADAAVITMFEGAGKEAIDGLLKQYTKSATHKFSGKCKGCGSTDFEFKSSFSGEKGADDEITVPELATSVSAEAIYAQASFSSMSIGRKSED